MKRTYKSLDPMNEIGQSIDQNNLEVLNVMFRLAYPDYTLVNLTDIDEPETPVLNDCYIVTATGTVWEKTVEKNDILRWDGTDWQILDKKLHEIYQVISDAEAARVAAEAARQAAETARVEAGAVLKEGDEIIGGVKTFESSPVLPDATLPQHPVTKAVFDSYKLSKVPESINKSDNIFPDPFLLKSSKLEQMPEVAGFTLSGSAATYEEGKITIPSGALVGIILKQSSIGLNTATEYANLLVKADISGGGIIFLAVDNVVSGSYGNLWGNLAPDTNYAGWLAFYNMTGFTSISGNVRVSLDNRSGTAPMIVESIYLFKGQNAKPSGLFLKDGWLANFTIKNIKPVITNYAPNFSFFDILNEVSIIVVEYDHLEFTSNISNANIGFDFLLSESKYSIGDTITYRIENIEISTSTALLYCIFYNGTTEISRTSITLTNANYFNNNTSVIPANTTRILFRIQAPAADQTIKVGRFYMSKEYLPPLESYKWIEEPIYGGINEGLKPVITNYAPDYSYFDIQAGISNLVLSNNSLQFTSTVNSSVYGFDFLLSESKYKVGDTITYRIENVEVSISTAQLYCIFYNGTTEISRTSITLTNADYFNNNTSVIPANTTRILFRIQAQAADQTIKVGRFYMSKEYLPPLESYKWIEEPIYGDEYILKSVAYVDAVSGNDSNSGVSFASPYKTFAKAIAATGDDTTIIFRGDTTENINIKQKPTQQRLSIIGLEGQLNRIIKGTKITGATLYNGETDVYQVSLASLNSGAYFYLFQHGINDVSTLISDAERHPLQRGKTHRCDSTIIRRTDSLATLLATTSSLLYYYDSAATTLYFRAVSGSNITNNPIYIPDGFGVYGNDGSVELNLVNFECLYCTLSLSKCHNSKISDVSVKYGFGGGGFIWDLANGITMTRCEAARIFSGTTTGDGFNAHSAPYPTINNANAKHTSATMIDCWSHDNNDDGYSDHERCETTIIGGLFEYNVKAGLTPAYGAHDTIDGAYCRKNVNGGISLVGGAATAEGGVGSQILVRNCISESNKNNYYVVGEAGLYDNKGTFINCISLNASEVGFLAGAYSQVKLINCYDYGSATAKSGAITIENATIIS